jgi:hypothetical protein
VAAGEARRFGGERVDRGLVADVDAQSEDGAGDPVERGARGLGVAAPREDAVAARGELPDKLQAEAPRRADDDGRARGGGGGGAHGGAGRCRSRQRWRDVWALGARRGASPSSRSQLLACQQKCFGGVARWPPPPARHTQLAHRSSRR